MVSGYVRGQLLAIVILSALYSLGLSIVGLRLAIPIGIVTGCLAFVPVHRLRHRACSSPSSMALLDWHSGAFVLQVARGDDLGVQVLDGLFVTPRVVGRSVGLGPGRGAPRDGGGGNALRVHRRAARGADRRDREDHHPADGAGVSPQRLLPSRSLIVTERAQRLVLLAIVLATIALHIPSFAASFTYDDGRTIVGHPGVQGALSFSDIFLRDWFGLRFDDPASVGTYRPLITLTFFLDAHLARGAAWPFHVTNVLLYAVLLVACDVFLRRWAGETLRPAARLLAIAGFAALAIHTDVVPSPTGRSEILAMLFSVVALTAALEETASARSVAVCAFALLAAMLSKESALPIALLVALFARRRARSWVPLAIASGVVLAGVVAFRLRHLPFRVSEQWYLHNPLLVAPRGVRLRGAAEVLVHYLTHTATGLELCPDYSYAAIMPEPQLGARALVGFALGALMIVGIVALHRRRPLVSEALLGFGATYVVVSHVVVPGSAIVADRWFFFPSFWIVVLLALGGDALARARPRVSPVVFGAALVLVVAQAVITATLVPTWRDNVALSARAVRNCPTAIGNRLLRASATRDAGQLEEAAWASLVAAVIHARFPAPIDDEALPGTWEDRPIPERRALLARALGSARAFHAVRESARGALRAQGMADVEAVLATWTP